MAKRPRGAPGIYELEPGVFKVVVSVGRDGDGRYRQRSRTVRGTLRDAKALRARFLTEAADGKLIARTDVTFGAVLERWLEHLETLGRSPTTITAYRVIARRHLQPALGEVPVSSITTLQLDNLYDALTRVRAPATVAKIHVVARSALGQAVRWGLIAHNPGLQASAPPIRHVEPRSATLDQLHCLVEAADDDFATVLILAATTGMRRGELCGLEWSALQLPSDGPGTALVCQVVVHGHDGRPLVRPSTKTGRSRRISLDAATVTTLRDHHERCETRRRVFCRGLSARSCSRLYPATQSPTSRTA